MRLKFLSILLISLLSLTFPALAQLIGNSTENWKIIKTKHFDVIVSAQQHDLGLYYAHAAEKSFQNLSKIFFNYDRSEKIVLILNDTTDVSNGFATRIPYPHIMAYVVPVGEHDSLSEAGEWSTELLTHELTHILQLQPARGFYKFLRPVFGNIIAPNMLTPLWWKEGMAVEMETQLSARGRLRSTYQDATLRGLTLDSKLDEQSLPRANEALPSWPFGARPYLLGSLFFSQLHEDSQDPGTAVTLVDRQAERVPYFIEEPLYELTQISYETQYQRALNKAETISHDQLKILKSQPVTNTRSMTNQVHISYMPSYNFKFKLLAFIEINEGESSIVIQNESGGRLIKNNLPSGQINSLEFHPAEKKILYSKIENIDSKYLYSDLYIYDIEQDKSDRLTTGQRARNAHFSFNGEQAAFVSTVGAQTQIRVLDLQTQKIKFIISSGYENRYESPIFWDEKTILAPKINSLGEYNLIKIDLNSLTESYTQLNFKQIKFLKKINNSLYFVSSENGVNNLYVTHDLKSAQPVSHVLTGIWSYDIHPDEKQGWASLMTSNGFQISQLEILKKKSPLPVIENHIGKRYQYKKSDYTYTQYPTEDYGAAPYLLPKYWIPFVATNSSSKGLFIQAQTTGYDPVKKHQYALSASYDSELNKGNFNGLYTNSTQKIPFQISSLIQSRSLGLSSNIVQTSTHAVALLPDLFEINKNLLFQFGLQLQEVKYTSVTQHAGPYAQLVYKNYDQSLFQISPEKGWGSSLKLEKNYRVKEEAPLTAIDFERASFSWIGFSQSGLSRHHALKAKVSALITFSNVLGRFGSGNTSGYIYAEDDSPFPQFVMRGYSNSQFFGRSLWNTNLEYRFPISQIEKGSGTDPYFIKRISGAFIADGIGVEGSGLTQHLTFENLKLNESFWNTGFELKFENTLGYILPLNIILGYYLPHSPLYAPSSQFGLSLQIGGF